eukprot:s360_g3.t1
MGTFTGKPYIFWENPWFPVNFPFNQSIELVATTASHHTESQAALNRLGKNQREMVVDSGGSVPMLETIEVSERPEQAEGGTSGVRSVNTTPRKKWLGWLPR